MAQVPYSPVPDVTPTAPAAPKIGVSTPPAAFGITTAEAVERLGGQAEKTGNVLAENALAIKGLENETWAKEEFVRQSTNIGQAEADFYSLKGKNAWNAKDAYQQKIQQIYEDAVNNAPNPQARKYLGDVLSRRITYSIVDGQRHAGQQFQEYQKGVSTDRVADAMATAAQHPYDDNMWGDAMATLTSEARAQAEQSGGGTDEYNRRVEQYKSMAWEQRLGVIANENPEMARQLYEKNKASIRGIAQNGEPYTIKIEKMLNTQEVRIGTRQVAHEILFAGDPDFETREDQSLTQGQRVGTEALPPGYRGQTLSPDSGPDFLQKALEKGQRYVQEHDSSPEFEDELYRRITSEYNQFSNAYKKTEYGTYTNLTGAIIGANGGTPIANMDSIYNNPNLAEQWKQLGETASGRERQRQLKTLMDNQFKKGTLEPEAQQALFEQIMGQGVAAERDTAKRDEFAKMDFGQLAGQLGQHYMSRLYEEQRHVQRVWEGKADALERNNRLQGAMAIVKPMLKNVGLDPNSTSKDVQDRYAQFEGAMYNWITDVETKTQKPMTDQLQIQGKAAQLLKEQGDRWWPFRNPRAFEVPQVQRDAIVKNFNSVYAGKGLTPTPQQISDIYQRILATPKGSQWRTGIGLE